MFRGYYVGLPGWKWFARARCTLIVRVNVRRDDEANVYIATSPDLDGLVVEAETLDELRTEVLGASDVLLELALRGQRPHARTDMRVIDPMPCAA